MEYKAFRELTLSDDFIFGEIMRQPRFCRPFLEELLQTNIAEISAVDKQKDLSDTYDAHGVRLDVYLEDADHTKYDIEMQTVTQPCLEKRIRHYTGDIDRYSLGKRASYPEMTDTFVIFICMSDYYKAGLAVYERESRIKGTDIPYEDGSHAYILNADYTEGNARRETLRFLDYLKARRNGSPFDTGDSELLKDIDEAIDQIKLDEGKEREYMTLAMKIQDERREERRISLAEGMKKGMETGMKKGMETGMKKGMEKGIKKGQRDMIESMLRRGRSPKEISDFTGIPLEDIERAKDNEP